MNFDLQYDSFDVFPKVKIVLFSYTDSVYFHAENFCHDYSFWSSHCHNATNVQKYTHATQCSSYDKTKSIEELGNDCSKSWQIQTYQNQKPYCPNSTNEEECSNKGVNYFYCPLSKTCIDRDKLCDGAVHCIIGEDESFEHCRNEFSVMFPKSATVQCIDASKPFYNITIKATPCNGLIECTNGEDEGWYCKSTLVSFFII